MDLRARTIYKILACPGLETFNRFDDIVAARRSLIRWGDRWLTGSSLRDLFDRHMNMASATTETARHTNTRGQSPGRLLTEPGYWGVNYLVRSVIAPVIGMIDIPVYQAPTGTYQTSRL
jgi:hypothetical protein